MAESAAAPEELTSMANVMTAPPMPFVPQQWHGKVVIMGLVCFAGPPEAGERAMAPFRALATPIVDMVKPMPYPQIYGPEPEDYHPIAAARNLFADEIDKDVAETIVDRLENYDAMMRVVQLRALGGAVARVPADATAYAHRSRPVMANVAALCTSVEEAAQRAAWVDDLAATVRQGGDDAAYVGFVGDEGDAGVRAAYPPATYARLGAVKAQYDPINLFRLNQNIVPATG
jgi:FAD/FMN-containing dehydrogenase